MDNLKQASIGKNRSYTSCLSEAHRMLFDNLRLIFFRTWPYCVALAVISAVLLSLCVNIMLYGNNSVMTTWLCVFSVATLCAEVAYYSKLMQLVNGRPMKWNLARCGKFAICYVVFWLLMSVIGLAASYGYAMSEQPANLDEAMPFTIGVSVVLFIISLLLLPYVYVAVKYMIEPESKLRKIIFKSYVTGLRRWGFIFIALFLTALCVVVCAMLVSMPMFIITIANSMSVYGVNFIGDPTGLPSNFVWLQTSVFALTFFVWSYINIFAVFVCYFVYGSIEAREEGKGKNKSEERRVKNEE